ncbi:MAG: 4-(cytidine 5'-diphospho)-2-C-methyl-D-erythritol kinase [Gammaproteobacteria bacterium]|nr:4-(cytidine 5'-diphospho)-2-C-methyl-D-erythritol kinase [Gammaproteobacteria bacterium]
MDSLSLLAPAKLNLFLHVTGRRADGYHELQTLFQLLDYGDRLRFESREDGVISLHVKDTLRGRDLPLENNLILRAASELARISGCKAGATIALDKRLPIGGGLGGGSSNAAAGMLALNELWGLGLSVDELCRIGVGLGADVPVFVRGRSAWGEGIGEMLEPVALPDQWYLVVTPPCEVSTAAVFNDENLTRNSAKIRIADFLAGRCRNDCEPVTRRLYPPVAEALSWLGRFGEARMSGTGASVFIPLANEAAGREFLTGLPAGWSGFVAKGVERIREN